MSLVGLKDIIPEGYFEWLGAGEPKKTKQHQPLVKGKLEQWEWIERFLAMNPDVAARWEQHKTYEILKDEQ